MSVIGQKGRRDKKQGNLEKLNLEAHLGPCRLLLLKGSLNTSKEAMNKNLLRPPGTWGPEANFPSATRPLSLETHLR